MAGQGLLRGALRTLRPPTLASTSSRVPARSESLRVPAPCALPPAWRTSHARCLQLSSGLCAGHNKWSKVKHIKGPKDEARGRVFMKYGMMIRVAVKEGGSNPDVNSNLAQILEQCRSKNMPKASIDAAIKSAEKAKPASQHVVEARGPGGCLLLIEVLTDNIAQNKQDMKRIIVRNGGMLSDGARNNFSKRGVVVAESGPDVSAERALELAIESGAEDVQEAEDEDEKPVLKFVCDTADVRKVRSSLEELGMNVTSSGLEFVPRAHLSLDEEQLDAAWSLIDVLSDHPDVIRVWDNIRAHGDS